MSLLSPESLALLGLMLAATVCLLMALWYWWVGHQARRELRRLDREMVEALMQDEEFRQGIREGVKALNEGRITPWSEVKKELGL